MSRYTGPTTRINRRFGMAIFPANKSFERRTYPPGQHGPSFRRKVSDYGEGLIEKQKLRMMYGLTESSSVIYSKELRERWELQAKFFSPCLRLDLIMLFIALV